MKRPVINHKDLYEFLPETGKRLIDIIGSKSAFTIMQEMGGKTYNNCHRKHSIFFKYCAGVLGDLEARRVVNLLSSRGDIYIYIPSLKHAISAQEKATMHQAVIAQYAENISKGMMILSARNAIAIQFDISERTVRTILKGGCDA
ncbi:MULTISPECIES: hypothetical protein [unclassified Serratia (in: enterobacteria)]|uniref:hypothetical protein n=1 Tax=unclassified Serratia (in: enterobacteria) TaxID=2647522 RepID=UPI0030767C77